jgi:P-type E1-E2 ATPase
LPHEKALKIRELKEQGEVVVMVGDGDGVNDAPALLEAHVGVSLGVSSLANEASNVVLVRDDLRQIIHLIELGRQALHITRQGATGGMLCSGVQMMFAAGGLISPFVSACMQEVIDLVSICNSFRVLGIRFDDSSDEDCD